MAVPNQTPERQALAEISLICSGALSHGADANGVVEILEAISAKAREHLDGFKPSAATKIAVLDGEGCIIGVGDTEKEARAEELKTIMTAPRFYLEGVVEEMMVRNVSQALAAKAMRDGGDVPYRIYEHMLVTPEEATAEAEERP